MRILGIIPARYASTRFPGKPLVDIAGKSMIRRVYEQCKKALLLTDVIVATEDDRILAHVLAFGGKAEMTGNQHLTGTDRAAEVAAKYPDFDAYINIQGDEPFIAPEAIDILCQKMIENTPQIATLIQEMSQISHLENPNSVKVVVNHKGYAMYFSRSMIPFLRNIHNLQKALSAHHFYQHIGIYGFSKETLAQLGNLLPSSLELAESLEQLRWLENGFTVLTAITDYQSIAIDTPEDLQKIKD